MTLSLHLEARGRRVTGVSRLMLIRSNFAVEAMSAATDDAAVADECTL
jgi:hypothetical protein